MNGPEEEGKVERTAEWIPAILRTTPGRWIHLAEAVPEELLRRAPAPSEWSALDCLRHLVDTELTVFPPRIMHLLRGEDFPGFDPDREGTRSGVPRTAGELAAGFDRLRKESLVLLASVESADLSRSARHQELGPVTMEELIHEWAGHDLMHTVQAERALLQPFLEKCGPWRRYFADHDASLRGK